MEKAKRETGLSPEEVERIKAAQIRHSAIDPYCLNLTPEEFISWHPVGGMTWEERARGLAARRKEEGLVLLNSRGSLGRAPGTIEVPIETAHWFVDFLGGTKRNDEHITDEITYKAERDSNDNVIFTENDDGFVCDLVFASWETQDVSDELLQELKVVEPLRCQR